LPASAVRHLGGGGCIPFAKGLRTIPGHDLGAEERRLQRQKTLEGRRAKAKGKGPSKEDLAAEQEMKAEAEVQAEIAKLEMLCKQLQEQKIKLITEQEESACSKEALIDKIKKAAKRESSRQENLGELLEDNEELERELKNDQLHYEQGRIFMQSTKEKIGVINKELEEDEAAGSGKKTGALAGIDIKFGPTSPESVVEIPEHEREVEWFEVNQLPKAILFAETQHQRHVLSKPRSHSRSRRGKTAHSDKNPKSMRASRSSPEKNPLAPLASPQALHRLPAWGD
jgi:hypothetical protein